MSGEENTSERPKLKFGQGLDSRTNVHKEPRSFDELPADVREIVLRKQGPDGRTDPTTLERLQGKHILDIILYVSRMSPVVKSDVYNDISRSSNMPEKIADLYDMGLIDVFSTGRTNNNVIVITEKGKAVAEKILSIIDVIEDR